VPFGVPAIVKAGEVPEQRRMLAQKEEALIASARAPATKITLGMMTDPRVIAQFPPTGADHRA
jgi:hypothetical protein